MEEIDGVKRSIEDVGNLYGKTIRAASELAKIFLSLKNSKSGDKVKESGRESLDNFTFTGKNTDLCYFNSSEEMPLSAIANIGDHELKKSVLECFDEFEKKGYVTLENDCIKITDKGKRILSDPQFQKQARIDQFKAYNDKLKNVQEESSEVQMCTSLTGDYVDDFTFFNHADQLDLRQIANHPNKDLSMQVLSNVKKWQSCGAVTVKDGIATVTPAAKKMLSDSGFKAAATKALPEKELTAMKNAPNQIVVLTKKIVSNVKQVISEPTKSNKNVRL